MLQAPANSKLWLQIRIAQPALGLLQSQRAKQQPRLQKIDLPAQRHLGLDGRWECLRASGACSAGIFICGRQVASDLRPRFGGRCFWVFLVYLRVGGRSFWRSVVQCCCDSIGGPGYIACKTHRRHLRR